MSYEPIDATTKSGFLALAAAFGRDRAWETRIAQFEARYERDKDFRWHGDKWRKAADAARFERDYEATHPADCALMRAAGVGY
jgi:hypothetical protein